MLLKHSLIYAVGKGLPSVLSLLAITLFTSLLTPEEFGKYALVLSVVSLLVPFLYQWLAFAQLRFIQSNEFSNDRLLATIFSSFLWSILITSLLFIIFRPILGEWKTMALIALPLIWAEGFFNLTTSVLQGRLEPRLYSIIGIIRSMVYLVVGGIIAYYGGGESAPLIGLLSGFLVASLIASSRVWKSFSVKPDRKILSTLFLYGFPFIFTVALNFIINSSDRFVIAYFLNNEAVGEYSAIYQFTWKTVAALLMVVNASSSPIVLRSFDKDGVKSANPEIMNTGVLLSLIGIPSCIGFIALDDSITHIFIGEAFRGQASALIPFIAVSTLLYAYKSYYVDMGFLISKKTYLQIWSSVIAASLNLILNILLIPKYGILGAAIATIVAIFIGLLVSVLLVIRIYPFPAFPWLSFLKILFCSGLMVVPIFIWQTEPNIYTLIMQLIICTFIYGVGIYLFNILDIRTHFLNKVKNIFK